MFESLRQTLGQIAPAIVSSLVPGGPLIHAGINAALSAFGIGDSDRPTDIQAATDLLASKVATATPEQILALKKADQDMQKFMLEIGYKETALYVQDTDHARMANAGNDKVFWLGVMVLMTFAVTTVVLLYGCYLMLIGGSGESVDQGVIAAVFTFLGTAFGYVAANAQQVISFFFGSSKGSKEKTDAMARSFENLGRRGANHGD